MLSPVRLFATPWTVVRQTPLSMGFPRQEYWSGWPCPPLGGRPHPGIKPESPVSPAFETSPLCVKIALSNPALCDPTDYTVHGIL